MDPVSSRVARRFQAENVFRTKVIPSATPEDVEDMLRYTRVLLASYEHDVVKKIVSSRKPPLRARDEWRELTESTAVRINNEMYEKRPMYYAGKAYESLIGAQHREVMAAIGSYRKLFWDFYDLTYTKANALPDGTDFNKAIKSEFKAWALLVHKASKDVETAFENYGDTLLSVPHSLKNGLQPDSIEEFQVSGLRFVVFDEKAAKVAPMYAYKAEYAYSALRAKGFGKVWYGTVVLKSHDFRQLSDWEQGQYRALGYEHLVETAGAYHSGSDEVVFNTGTNGFAYTIIHEFGHRWWYKMLDRSQRARFNDLVKTNPSTQTRDWPSGHTTEDGAEKPVTPVSNYGKSSIEEAFAEAFAHYVLGDDMDLDQAESFRSVLRKQAGSVYPSTWQESP